MEPNQIPLNFKASYQRLPNGSIHHIVTHENLLSPHTPAGFSLCRAIGLTTKWQEGDGKVDVCKACLGLKQHARKA